MWPDNFNVFCASQGPEEFRPLLFRQRMVVIMFDASETVRILIPCQLLGKISTLFADESLASSVVAQEKGCQKLLFKRHGRQIFSMYSN
jgi:hypothetical protein